MRRIQTHIPKAGKLGQKIHRSRSFGLSNFDFSQQIASKYSGLKLGKFQLANLILLLQKASSESSVLNVTQILKKEVISALPSTTEFKFKARNIKSMKVQQHKQSREKSLFL